MSNKGLDTKSKGTEENQETENNKQDEEDELGDEEPNDGVSTSDWHRGPLNRDLLKKTMVFQSCPVDGGIAPEDCRYSWNMNFRPACEGVL